MKRTHALLATSLAASNALAQSPFLDARGNTSLLLPSGGYLQLAFDQSRATFGFAKRDRFGFFQGLELNAKPSGDTATVFSDDRLADDVTLKLTLGLELRAADVYRRGAQLQREVVLEVQQVALTDDYLDILKRIEGGADGVVKAQERAQTTSNADLLARIEDDRKKRAKAYADALTDLEALFKDDADSILVKPPIKWIEALANLKSSDFKVISSTAGDLIKQYGNESLASYLDALGQVKSAARTLGRSGARNTLAGQKAAKGYADALAKLETLSKDKSNAEMVKEPFTWNNALQQLRSPDFSEVSDVAGQLRAQHKDEYFGRKSHIAELNDEIEGLTKTYDKVALVVKGQRSKYKLYDGQKDFKNQFSNETFEGWGATLNYNMLIPGARFGLALGFERSNNIDDLNQVDFTDTTTDTSGDVTRTSQSKTKAYVGEYQTLERIPLRFDAVWWPSQFQGTVGLTAYLRGDLHRTGDTFAPGLGLFLSKKGAPTSVVGGLTVLFPKGRTEVAIVAGYSF